MKNPEPENSNSTEIRKLSGFKVPMGVLGGDVSDDGRHLVLACMDGVILADLAGENRNQICRHNGYASSALFLDDALNVVSAGYDGRIQWIDSTGNMIRQKQVHDFWSWDLALSPDSRRMASSTGQYLPGDYRYKPAAEKEPSVRILDVATGEILFDLSHVPSVQSVAFSNDGAYVAAGNLMGEIRVWDAANGDMVNSWTTPDFTSWGIIKSHCYLGGVFGLRFCNDNHDLLLCGMGPMRDPMAGNGKQLWQHWTWKDRTPELVSQTQKAQAGEGLMETLAVHPDGKRFVMGGRLRGGDWNLAMFSLETGERLAALKTGYRITTARFSTDGTRLILLGMQGQPRPTKSGSFPDFGRVEVYSVS